MITGEPGSGKSTSIFGSLEHKIAGLNPAETLYICASGKPVHASVALHYKPIPLANLGKTHLTGKEPSQFNYITVDSGKDDANKLITFIHKVIKHGIKSPLDKKTYKVKNVVIDDFQDYINNCFYRAQNSDGYEKFNDVFNFPKNLVDLAKGIQTKEQNSQHFKENERVDFFYFMHVAKLDPKLPRSATNYLDFKIPGNMLKHVYSLHGEFNNLILLEKHRFFGKSHKEYPMIRTEEGVIEDGSKADLALIKHNINMLYTQQETKVYVNPYATTNK